MPDPAITVVLLAGGEATRLPGKLFLPAGDVPLLVRAYRNASVGRPVVVACREPLPPAVAAAIDAPIVYDAWPQRGPLGGLLTAFEAVRTPWAFALAGDAPHIDAAFIDALARHIAPGDEAIVPQRDGGPRGGLEPLAALYGRDAFLREGVPLLQSGDSALRSVIARLTTRFVRFADAGPFANINTPADYAAAQAGLA